MPKSKRNKIVHLTQVKKKGKDHKDDLKKQLEQYVRQFKLVYLFDFESTKSDRIMSLRLKLKGIGRIFAGRNSIVAVALKAIGSQTNTNFDHLLKHIAGQKGLLFTDEPSDKLVELIDSELPEFREKLLGYAQLGCADQPLNEATGEIGGVTGADSKTPATTTKRKTTAKKKKSGPREVNFVKI